MSHYFPTSGECGHRMIFDKIKITTCAGDNVQMSLAEIPARVAVPEHSHPNEQVGMIIAGDLSFTIAGETRTLKPGDMFRIPGGVPHSVVALDQPVRVLDIFYPIRDEYR